MTWRARDFRWLLVSCLVIPFAGPQWNVPVASWLVPILLVRFYRTQGSLRAVAAGLALLFVASGVRTWWMLPQGSSWLSHLLVPGADFCLLLALPYAVDRFVSRRVKGALSTLVFPSVYVLCEYVLTLTPASSILTVGYSQSTFHALAQLSSVTGIWGISFLMAWLGPVVNEAWEKRFNPEVLRRAPLAYLLTFTIVLAWGGYRYYMSEPQSSMVATGAVLEDTTTDIWGYVERGAPPGEAPRYRAAARELEDRVLGSSKKLAEKGARIVLWNVGNIFVFKEDEGSFLEKASTLARTQGVYLFSSVNTIFPGRQEVENKVIAFQPDGAVGFEYYKSRPAPGELLEGEGGTIRTLDTPYGRIAAVICYDADYPELVLGAGRASADILLVVSDDPISQMAWYRSRYTVFRGIENGLSVFRNSHSGILCVSDYLGTIHAQLSSRRLADRGVIVYVPTRGARTLYALAGDWFIWALLGFTGFMAVFVLLRTLRRGHNRLDCREEAFGRGAGGDREKLKGGRFYSATLRFEPISTCSTRTLAESFARGSIWGTAR